MKLYSKVIPLMARDITEALVKNEDIELEEGLEKEAPKDFEAILNEYQRGEREISDLAKDVLNSRGWGNAKFSEARKIAATAKKFPMGDDALDYVINQMLEYMLISPNIAEVYAEDHVMRKRIVVIMRRYLSLDDELDAEVRKRLRNLQEGTRDWEIAYKKTMEEVRRLKGL